MACGLVFYKPHSLDPRARFPSRPATILDKKARYPIKVSRHQPAKNHESKTHKSRMHAGKADPVTVE